jgi:hypothetical protein
MKEDGSEVEITWSSQVPDDKCLDSFVEILKNLVHLVSLPIKVSTSIFFPILKPVSTHRETQKHKTYPQTKFYN